MTKNVPNFEYNAISFERQLKARLKKKIDCRAFKVPNFGSALKPHDGHGDK